MDRPICSWEVRSTGNSLGYPGFVIAALEDERRAPVQKGRLVREKTSCLHEVTTNRGAKAFWLLGH